MQPFKVAFILFAALLLCIFGVTSEAGYIIFSDALSSSGGEAENSKYLLGTTLGQTVIGISSNATYIEAVGFWHPGVPPWRSSGVSSGSHPEIPLPKEYGLSQNYPNPFNPTTIVRYQLSAEEGPRMAVTLKVYNVLGQLVRTLVDKEQAPGYYSVVWDARDDYGRELASGVYLYRLEVGKYSSSKKLLLLK